MNRAVRKFSRPVRAVILAVLVHVAFGLLLGLSLSFKPQVIKPGIAQPVKAIVIEKKRKKEPDRSAIALEETSKKEAEKKRKAEEAREQEEQDAYSALRSLVGAIKGKIEGNWSNRLACSGQEVTISVKVNISGEVTTVQVVGDSGDDACRRSAENAVYKASPLPFPDNPRFFKWLDQEFQIIFKPDI